jgi:hypothetical protein
LPHAKRIIKKSTTLQNITIRNGKEYYVFEAVVLVTERGRRSPRKVRVVIEKDRKGQLNFYRLWTKRGI